MPRLGLLITGTDTGVGKTFVTCGLAGALRRRGLRVAPFKPAETGCEPDAKSRSLIPADAIKLRQATQTPVSLETICPYRFHAPVAPWVAAEQEGVQIDTKRLERCYRELAYSHEIVLVETAGGILVPLAEGFTYADLARLLGLPVLVVIGSKLGAINHTLLTAEFLRSSGLPAAGYVLNHPYEEESPAAASNEKTLRSLVQGTLHVVPHLSGSEPPWECKRFDEFLAPVVDWCADAD